MAARQTGDCPAGAAADRRQQAEAAASCCGWCTRSGSSPAHLCKTLPQHCSRAECQVLLRPARWITVGLSCVFAELRSPGQGTEQLPEAASVAVYARWCTIPLTAMHGLFADRVALRGHYAMEDVVCASFPERDCHAGCRIQEMD
jgi:hypothetical protein